MRGEYSWKKNIVFAWQELPPRARRIRHRRHAGRHRHGTTSACAENTAPKRHGARYPGNYLRVRGEYRHPRFRETINPELPPRARRIRYTTQGVRFEYGTTSACAENTIAYEYHCYHRGNYLRVRGEYLAFSASRVHNGGTTSACAENTSPLYGVAVYRGNYLRVRGEYITFCATTPANTELPPRARRIPPLNLPSWI